MKEIIYLVGLPCSGKTTWANKIYPEAVFISNDLVIEEIAKEQGLTYDDVWGKIDYKLVKKKCRAKFDQAVAEEAPVIIIDNTNLTEKSRKTYSAPGYDKSCVLFLAPEWLLHERNVRPGKTIPDQAFECLKKRYQSPTLDEGFTEIKTVEAWQ